MGIHRPPIRSRSRASSAPSYNLFGRDHQTNHVDRDGRVRFQICSVQDAMLVGFFPFPKAAWERKKARKLELSSFVFPRNVKDTCPVLARLSPLQTSRHLPLLFPLPSVPSCFRRFYSKFLPRSGIVTRQTVRKSQFPLLYSQLVFKPQIRAASGTLADLYWEK